MNLNKSVDQFHNKVEGLMMVRVTETCSLV